MEYIDSTSKFIIFSGNYRSRSSQNALQQVRWSKLPGLDPVSGSAGGTLDTVKSVVRAIPNSTETPECLPDFHEGPPNLAESNVAHICHANFNLSCNFNLSHMSRKF
jgi:hypothetical protein